MDADGDLDRRGGARHGVGVADLQSVAARRRGVCGPCSRVSISCLRTRTTSTSTYDRTIVAGTVRGGEALWKRVDVAVIDAAANALAATVQALGGAWRGWATRQRPGLRAQLVRRRRRRAGARARRSGGLNDGVGRSCLADLRAGSRRAGAVRRSPPMRRPLSAAPPPRFRWFRSPSPCGSGAASTHPRAGFQLVEHARLDPAFRHLVVPRHRRHLSAADPAHGRCSRRWCCISATDSRFTGGSRRTWSRCCCSRATMLGTLVALDLVLFYVFWELMLVPMFLIIGIWGGERRVYAAIKFLLFTMVGSLPMLAAILYLGLRTRPGGRIAELRADRPLRLARYRLGASAGCFLAFCARVRDQGADVPAAHLAARRPRRGADGRLGDPGRRAAEDGHLRLPALRDAAVPRRGRRARRRGSARSR